MKSKWVHCECEICSGDLTCGHCAYFEDKTGICQERDMRMISLTYEGQEYEVNADTPACHNVRPL
jgi:hypothetical protein